MYLKYCKIHLKHTMKKLLPIIFFILLLIGLLAFALNSELLRGQLLGDGSNNGSELKSITLGKEITNDINISADLKASHNGIDWKTLIEDGAVLPSSETGGFSLQENDFIILDIAWSVPDNVQVNANDYFKVQVSSEYMNFRFQPSNSGTPHPSNPDPTKYEELYKGGVLLGFWTLENNEITFIASESFSDFTNRNGSFGIMGSVTEILESDTSTDLTINGESIPGITVTPPAPPSPPSTSPFPSSWFPTQTDSKVYKYSGYKSTGELEWHISSGYHIHTPAATFEDHSDVPESEKMIIYDYADGDYKFTNISPFWSITAPKNATGLPSTKYFSMISYTANFQSYFPRVYQSGAESNSDFISRIENSDTPCYGISNDGKHLIANVGILGQNGIPIATNNESMATIFDKYATKEETITMMKSFGYDGQFTWEGETFMIDSYANGQVTHINFIVHTNGTLGSAYTNTVEYRTPSETQTVTAVVDRITTGGFVDAQEPYSIQLIKFDDMSGNPIPNTTFSLEKFESGVWTNLINGSEITGTTTNSGSIEFKNLTPGTYRLVETSAASGFDKNTLKIYLQSGQFSDAGFTADYTNEITEFTISDSSNTIALIATNEKLTGELQINKIDGSTDTPLDGAEFILYQSISGVKNYVSADGSFTTDIANAMKYTTTGGTVTISNLIYGTYFVQEITAPAGYILPTELFTRDLNTNTAPEVLTIENNLDVGSITINKVDSKTNTPLANAEFYLYSKSGADNVYVNSDGSTTTDISSASFYTTTADGKITIPNLDLGTYYISEKTAPEGYVLSTSEIQIDLSGSNRNPTILVQNTKDVGSVTITKTDNVTSTPLANAEYIVYYIDGETYNYFNTDGNFYTHPSNASKFTTDTSGTVTINNLPLGTYFIQETDAPENYLLPTDPISVTISTTTKNLNLPISNTLAVGSLTILKTDGTSNAPLSGAEFIISRNISGTKSYFTATETFSSTRDDAAKFTTNASGLVLINNLPLDTYTIEEITAPNNYVLNTTEYSSTLSEAIKFQSITITNTKDVGSIEITKTDSRISTLLPNAEFVVYAKSTGDIKNYFNSTTNSFSTDIANATKYVTDSTGKVTITNIPLDNYFIQEVVAPTDYELNTTEYPVTINSADKTGEISISNIKNTGSIEITKTNLDGSIVLENAQFIIYTTVNSVNYYLNNDGTLTQDRASASLYTTDSLGRITISNVPAYEYYIEETIAPADYVLNTTPTQLTVTVSPTPSTTTITNSKDIGSIEITKTDSRTSELLATAQFVVYTKSTGDVKNYFNSTTNSFSTDIADATRYTTDSTGKVTATNLPLDNYFVQEVTAPNDYVLNTTEYPVTINDTDKNGTTTITNTKDIGSIQINKIDGTTNALLSDAQFIIYTKNGSGTNEYFNTAGTFSPDIANASSFTSVNGIITITNLPLDTYYIKETVAPDGYVLSTTEHQVIISSANKLGTISISNNKDIGSVEITKTDSRTSEVLGNAEFVIFTEAVIGTRNYFTTTGTFTTDINSAAKFTTDSLGKVTITNLPLDSYFVTEVTAPTDYVLNTTVYPVTINSTNKVGTLTITNTKDIGSIEITKTDSRTGETLENAEFVVYTINEGTNYYFNSGDSSFTTTLASATRYTTGVNGKVTINNIPLDTYYIQETSAPTNYVINTNIFDLTINSTNKNGTITITNTKNIGSLQITKVDTANSLTLPDAEFILYTIDNGVNNYFNSTSSTFTQTESSAERYTTNASGIINITNIPYDTYYIKEVVAPDGYVISPTIHQVTINEADSTGTISIENNKDIGQISIRKTDNITNALLDNAEFVVYKKVAGVNNYFNTDGSFTTNENTASKYTTSSGVAVITNIPLDTYFIREVTAPNNYVLNTTEYSTTIDSTTKQIEISVTNTKDIGSITISKTDSRTSESLANAGFVIYTETVPNVKNYFNSTTNSFSSDINDATTFTTNTSGSVTINNLPLDNYFIEEVVAPDEYVLNTTKYPINIDSTNKNGNITIQNSKDTGSLEITKVDSLTNAFLSNAEFVIYTVNSGINNYFNLDGSFTTEENNAYRFTTINGKVTINNLPIDTYFIKEVNAPKDYAISTTPTEITLSTSNKNVSTTITNKKDIGNITITKSDLQTSELIDGAEFIIYSKNGSTFNYFNEDKSFVQDESIATKYLVKDGSLTITDIPLDTYFLKEVTAPLGYILSTDEHTITISETSKDGTINIMNKQITTVTPELPSTDSDNTTDNDSNNNSSDIPYTGDTTNQIVLLAIMIISGTCIIFLIIRKKNKKVKKQNRYK